jgi:hypothetical protein
MHNTIIDNLVTISNLKINDKLIIENNNVFKIDNRVILSFRRYVDGYCRKDIILPIISMYTHLFNWIHIPRIFNHKKHFVNYSNYRDYIIDLMFQSLEGLKRLCNTYNFEFTELNKIVNWLQETLNKQKKPLIDLFHSIQPYKINQMYYLYWLHCIIYKKYDKLKLKKPVIV